MLAGAFALLGISQTFAAPVSEDPPSYHVRFDDLNLESPAGRRSLYSRVDGAAGIVCRSLEGNGLALQVRHKRCLNEAVARAVLQINNPRVTEYYSERHNGKLPEDVLPTQEAKAPVRTVATSK
jgi:UrcA family protein